MKGEFKPLRSERIIALSLALVSLFCVYMSMVRRNRDPFKSILRKKCRGTNKLQAGDKVDTSLHNGLLKTQWYQVIVP